MILEEIARLSCPAESVVAFLDDLETQYRSWHPSHILFRWVGPAGDERSQFFFDERIGSWRLRVRMRAHRPHPFHLSCVPVSPFWRAVFPGMTFAVEKDGSGCRYAHRIALRLGPFKPMLERSLLAPLRRHMAEEAVNLERLIGDGLQG